MQKTKFFDIKLVKFKLMIITSFYLFTLLFISSCDVPSVNMTSWTLNQFRDGRITLYDVNDDNVMDLIVSGYQKGEEIDLKKVLFIESGFKKSESSNGTWKEKGYSFYLDDKNTLWAKTKFKAWKVDRNYFKNDVQAKVNSNDNLDILVNGVRVPVKNNKWELDSVLKIWLDEYDRMCIQENSGKKQFVAKRLWNRHFTVLVNPIGEWIKGSGYKRGGKLDADAVPIGNNIVAINGKNQNILWSFQAGDSIETYPSVSDGVVYFGSTDKNFYALDAKTGKIKWSYRTNAPIYSSAVVTKEMLYFGNRNGILYALDNKYGSLVWSFKTRLGIDSSPAFYDDKVFFGSWDKHFYALDSNSGRVVWEKTFDSYVQTSPIIFNDTVYFGAWNGKVYALDEATGKTIWSFQTDDWLDKASPVIGRNALIYIGNKRGNVYAINAYNGYLKWMFSAGDAITSAPVVSKNRVYVASRDGFLYALNPKNGNLIWERGTRFKIYTSPTLNEEEIYLSSRGGYLWAIKDTNMGNPEWSMFGGSPSNKRTSGTAFNFSKELVKSKGHFFSRIIKEYF